jgi:hypothetical protein
MASGGAHILPKGRRSARATQGGKRYARASPGGRKDTRQRSNVSARTRSELAICYRNRYFAGGVPDANNTTHGIVPSPGEAEPGHDDP